MAGITDYQRLLSTKSFKINMDPAVFVVLQDCSAFLCSLNENFIQKKLRMRILFKKGKKFLHLQLLQLRCWNPCKFAGRKRCAQHAKLSAKWPEPGSLLVLTSLTTGTESSCISGCFSWFWLVELWLLNTWEQQGFGTCSGQQDCPAAGLALSTKPRCERVWLGPTLLLSPGSATAITGY